MEHFTCSISDSIIQIALRDSAQTVMDERGRAKGVARLMGNGLMEAAQTGNADSGLYRCSCSL